jgi:hypothetical protein
MTFEFRKLQTQIRFDERAFQNTCDQMLCEYSRCCVGREVGKVRCGTSYDCVKTNNDPTLGISLGVSIGLTLLVVIIILITILIKYLVAKRVVERNNMTVNNIKSIELNIPPNDIRTIQSKETLLNFTQNKADEDKLESSYNARNFTIALPDDSHTYTAPPRIELEYNEKPFSIASPELFNEPSATTVNKELKKENNLTHLKEEGKEPISPTNKVISRKNSSSSEENNRNKSPSKGSEKISEVEEPEETPNEDVGHFGDLL